MKLVSGICNLDVMNKLLKAVEWELNVEGEKPPRSEKIRNGTKFKVDKLKSSHIV